MICPFSYVNCEKNLHSSPFIVWNLFSVQLRAGQYSDGTLRRDNGESFIKGLFMKCGEGQGNGYEEVRHPVLGPEPPKTEGLPSGGPQGIALGRKPLVPEQGRQGGSRRVNTHCISYMCLLLCKPTAVQKEKKFGGHYQ